MGKPIKTSRSQPPRTGAQYRVTERSYIDGRIIEPGETIFYGGIPGSKLEPLNAEAEKAKADALATKAHAKLPVSDADRGKLQAELDTVNKASEKLAAERAAFEKERADFEAAKLAAAAAVPPAGTKPTGK